eukprot:m.19345 g.19345  ORF g.19345 m.19345 type:complete len:636 (+) comp12422_c1_seq1:1421-3328(+)
MSEYATVAVVLAAAGAGAYHFLSQPEEKKKEKVTKEVVVEETGPREKVAQVEGAPNEVRRARRAAAAKRKAALEKEAANAAKVSQEKELERLRILDAKAKKESEKLRIANLAQILKEKEDRKKELNAQQRKRDQEKKERDAALKKQAEANKIIKAEKEKQKAINKAKEAEYEVIRAEKAKKLAERSAKRKKEIAEEEQRQRELKQRLAEADARQAEEDAAIRKAELELEQAKLSKSANWEAANKIAVGKKAERAALAIKKKQQKIEKNKAKAAERQKLAESLIVVGPRESAVGADSVESKGAFTIERAVPDEEEDDEEEEVAAPVEETKEEAKEVETKEEEPTPVVAEETKEEEPKEAAVEDKLDAVESAQEEIKKDVNDAQSRLAAIKARADTLQAKTATPPAAVVDATPAPAPTPTLTAKDWNVKPQAAYVTYEDDVSFGKSAPDIDSVEFVKGGPVAVADGGKTTVIMFFAKFAKGDYTTIVGLSRIVELFPDVNFVGLSIDPEKADVESFVKKIGTAMPEIYIDELVVNFPLAWDKGKLVKEEYRKTAGLMSLGASAIFVIDAKEKIVWREQFGQGYPPKMGQLAEQIRRHLAGEALLSNGPKPAAEEESDSDPNEGSEPEFDDYDSDLGF